MIEAAGVVAEGHRVASGMGGDPRFPDGTIRAQLPGLRAAIPDLDAYLGGAPFPGTINLRVAGARVVLRTPEIRIAALRWTAAFPPETFYLSRAGIVHAAVAYPAFLYIPDPATKPDHHQATDIVELLARPVPGLRYGDAVTLRFSADAIAWV